MDGFLQGFSNVAEELGVKVGLKHKKINISNPRVSSFAWNLCAIWKFIHFRFLTREAILNYHLSYNNIFYDMIYR